VDFGTGPRVTVVTPEQVGSIVRGVTAPADPSLAGFTTLVANLDRVSDMLTRNSVPFQAVGARLAPPGVTATGPSRCRSCISWLSMIVKTFAANMGR
jgi:hypothetical protein